MNTHQPDPDCLHKRGLNLETRRYYCEKCGVDWDSMKSKKTLFCGCFMVRNERGQWEAEKIYMHCDSIEEARLQFFRSEQRVVSKVVIAAVVGYLTDDDNADNVEA